jgi:hypothetical protein
METKQGYVNLAVEALSKLGDDLPRSSRVAVLDQQARAWLERGSDNAVDHATG